MIEFSDLPFGVEEPDTPRIDGDVVELSLLLPGWQLSKLETVAHRHGLTAGAMVRHLLRDFLTETPASRRTLVP